MFTAWWVPFSRFGVIHGDPHLGNYTVFAEKGKPAGINLLDYGCIRIFPPSFVGGVVDLYNGLRDGDDARVVHAYETWGFKKLSREVIDILNIWARFIYGPLMDDRVRSIADGVKPGDYGRRQAFEVHQALRKKGPVTVPREFVLMDRAAIGLGGVFLHLRAELNFHRLFEAAMENFSVKGVADRQAAALKRVGLDGAARRRLGVFHSPRAGCDTRRVGLPGGIRLLGHGPRCRALSPGCRNSARSAATMNPNGEDLMLVRLGLLCRPDGWGVAAARRARAKLRRGNQQADVQGHREADHPLPARHQADPGKGRHPKLVQEECRIARQLRPRLEDQLAAMKQSGCVKDPQMGNMIADIVRGHEDDLAMARKTTSRSECR